VKSWKSIIAVIVLLLAALALAKPYCDARMSWYTHGGELDGKNLLITCNSKTPSFMYGGGPIDTTFEEPLFSGLEVYFACRAANRNVDELIGATSTLSGNNPTMDDLVDQTTNCSHLSFSAEESQRCMQSFFDSIDWMIEKGVDLNHPNSCGYLHSTVHKMNEKMFYFLLSRGADPNQLCPPESAVFGEGVERLIDTDSKTVAQLLTVLLSQRTDQEKLTIVADWTRMLERIQPSTK